MVIPKWRKANAQQIAEAIDMAERTSGHQILVRVGPLGKYPGRVADKIATRYSQASLVFCVDPRRRVFEVRWSTSLQLDSNQAATSVQEHLRAQNLPAAITALAALLPQLQEGAELPDIIEESD